MAMEMHVLFRGTLPSKAALTRAMKELGFPLSIASRGSLETQTGFMPMRLQREETGAEFDVFNGREAVDELVPEAGSAAFERVASFRWTGEDDGVAAMCAAAVLAKLTGGMVLEEFEGTLMPADEAIRYARHYLEPMLKPQAKHPGTRPADIKRYLAPLLKLRRDLMLIEGDTLIIRPVRHILRGVLLARTRDKYRFRICCFIAPLYDGHQYGGYPEDEIHSHLWDVWQPHFTALLMDSLFEDALSKVGSITSLAQLATTDDSRYFSVWRTDRVRALVLAGELDRARDYARALQQQDGIPTSELQQHRSILEQPIEDICRHFHDREAKAAKVLKLSDAWEPSPFPVELPPAQRAGRVDEPPFAPKPWIDRPAWLLQDVPEQPGDIRFAKDSFARDGRPMLLVPLDRQEAEIRHRDRGSYVLATRLPNGMLAVLTRDTRWDRNHPDDLFDFGDLGLRLRLYGEHCTAFTWCDVAREETSLRLSSIHAYARSATRSKWQCSTTDEILIHDDRTVPRTVIRRALNADDEAILRSSIPPFGDVEDLATRLLAWLRHAGYGDLP